MEDEKVIVKGHNSIHKGVDKSKQIKGTPRSEYVQRFFHFQDVICQGLQLNFKLELTSQNAYKAHKVL